MLADSITRMKLHESKEKKGSILEDKTQIGYLNMIEVILIASFAINLFRKS
jgi:hypothetical protein